MGNCGAFSCTGFLLDFWSFNIRNCTTNIASVLLVAQVENLCN